MLTYVCVILIDFQAHRDTFIQNTAKTKKQNLSVIAEDAIWVYIFWRLQRAWPRGYRWNNLGNSTASIRHCQSPVIALFYWDFPVLVKSNGEVGRKAKVSERTNKYKGWWTYADERGKVIKIRKEQNVGGMHIQKIQFSLQAKPARALKYHDKNTRLFFNPFVLHSSASKLMPGWCH